MPDRDHLSVRELVNDAGFDLQLLTGEVGLDRTVRGIHLSDYEDPTPWMATGSLLITTGASFVDSPAAAVRFLEKIAEKDTVALGVGVGQHGHLEHVCAEMVARAKELRLPVFEIPETVPFRTMFAYVYNALASTDLHRLRRALSVQAQLLDLLLEEKGIGEVLARLASILSMSVLLFDAHGKVVAQAGTAELGSDESKRIWRTYEAADDLGPLNVLEAEHGRFHLREVKIHGSVERVLAAIVHQPPPNSEFAEIALSFAQRLINLDLLRESEQIALRRRMRALLLDDLLVRSDVDHDLTQRLLDQDIDLRREWRVIVCDGVDPTGDDAGKPDEKESYEFRARLCAAAEAFLRKRQLQAISMVKSDQIVLLAVVDGLERDRTHRLLASLRARLGDEGSPAICVGSSAPSRGDVRPAAALRQAGEAARAAAEGAGVVDGVVLFEEVGGRFRVLTGQSDEALAALVDRLIKPLADHDQAHHTSLLPTLRVFFDSRLSAHETAEALYIHRNTLHNRLRRIEDLLRIDFGRMDDVLELYVGLRAAELLERRTS